jgi:hypothetical protein
MYVSFNSSIILDPTFPLAFLAEDTYLAKKKSILNESYTCPKNKYMIISHIIFV